MSVRTIRRAAEIVREDMRYRRLLHERSTYENVGREPCKIIGDYLVATDRGLYVIDERGIGRVSRADGFGLALDNASIFATTQCGRDSIVLAGGRGALLDRGSPFRWRELLRIEEAGHAGRIHQIGVNGDDLWVTDTAKNLLSRYDKNSGAWKASIAPFRCSFGHPILNDHNHINAVFPRKEYVLFTAFRANRTSIIGLCGNGDIRLYAYENMGCHDCVFENGNLWFSDSYRFFDEKANGGALLRNGEIFSPQTFDAEPAGFVRGLAAEGDELLVGCSFSGNRTERFESFGHFLLFVGDECHGRFGAPAGQIYDIVRLKDGAHFPGNDGVRDWRDAVDVLDRYLGKPVEILQLEDCLVGCSGKKKFSAADRGDIGGIDRATDLRA